MGFWVLGRWQVESQWGGAVLVGVTCVEVGPSRFLEMKDQWFLALLGLLRVGGPIPSHPIPIYEWTWGCLLLLPARWHFLCNASMIRSFSPCDESRGRID